ncbi:hypothetical protein RRG08_008232 [Elysia crispata]|uniref:Uncharacterized protein n=1 Tax=Elysia crispata TaxID=231223 RepID=A0AAE1CWB0_9GAST|nr:hypothetical protein RRG08_008232 [Elysia crispata]
MDEALSCPEAHQVRIMSRAGPAFYFVCQPVNLSPGLQPAESMGAGAPSSQCGCRRLHDYGWITLNRVTLAVCIDLVIKL